MNKSIKKTNLWQSIVFFSCGFNFCFIFLSLLLVCGSCFGATLETARGTLEVSDGDVFAQNLKATGQIVGLNNVTFHSWNFSRPTKEVVFVDCTNITIIDSNLMNVIIPEGKGFVLINSSNLYRREFVQDGELYEEVILKDGQKHTSLILRETIDIVERDFGNEKGYTQAQRDSIKQSYLEEGLTVMRNIDEIINRDYLRRITRTSVPTNPFEGQMYKLGNEIKIYRKGSWISGTRKEAATNEEKIKVFDSRKFAPKSRFLPQ